MEHLDEGEMGFAEAAAGDEDAETGGGIEDGFLVRVEAVDGFAGVAARHGWPQIRR
jgi:hypothetical protein